MLLEFILTSSGNVTSRIEPYGVGFAVTVACPSDVVLSSMTPA